MMFDKILLTGSSDMVLFDLRNPASSPFITKSVDGLGPTETNISTTQSVQGLGRLSGKMAQLREITFNLMLKPRYEVNETLATVRDDLYRSYLRSVRSDGSLDLRIEFNNQEIARTPVHVKRLESNPFTKDALMQLVLSSTDQYLHRDEPYLLEGAEAAQLSTTDPIFENIGTAPTGFFFSVSMLSEGTSFGLSRAVPNEKFEVVYDFEAGDILEVDTRPGKRQVLLHRGGAILNALTGVSNASTWFTIPSGPSQFSVLPNSVVSFSWLKLEYNPLYLGV